MLKTALYSCCISLCILQACVPAIRFNSRYGGGYSIQYAAKSTQQNKNSLKNIPAKDDGQQNNEKAKADLSDLQMQGFASFYGPEFNGRVTASGEYYDETSMSAAHRTLPFGTFLSVRNLKNKRTVIVRINDRGPFHPDRILDLSRSAAEELDMIRDGVTEIEAEILE
jgi:rare lipoprotein A (peptidoglycan hydrolase)